MSNPHSTSESAALIDEYTRCMLKANESVNLTAVREYERACVLHVEDSLSALEVARLYAKEGFLDIGSGCGFPGVALALALGVHCELLDSSSKKMKAVSSILHALGIDDRIVTHDMRIEEFGAAHPEEYSLITARALAATRVVLELASPLLKTGGHLLLYKSSGVDEEIAQAEPMLEKVGMAFTSRADAVLSNGDPRSIIVYEKVHEPLISLPRRVGKAQKSPLS